MAADIRNEIGGEQASRIIAQFGLANDRGLFTVSEATLKTMLAYAYKAGYNADCMRVGFKERRKEEKA